MADIRPFVDRSEVSKGETAAARPYLSECAPLTPRPLHPLERRGDRIHGCDVGELILSQETFTINRTESGMRRRSDIPSSVDCHYSAILNLRCSAGRRATERVSYSVIASRVSHRAHLPEVYGYLSDLRAASQGAVCYHIDLHVFQGLR